MRFTDTYFGYIIKNNKRVKVIAVYKEQEFFYCLSNKRRVNITPKKNTDKYFDRTSIIRVSDYINVYDRYLDYSYRKVRKNTKKIKKKML